MGAMNVTTQVVWLYHFITELGVHFHHLKVILWDNQSTLKLCRDPSQR
jgi:hypothetical protein